MKNMHKMTFIMALIAIGFAATTLSLTGCDNGTTPSHTHNYGTAWSSNGTQHWHECSCGDKKDAVKHSGTPCTVCGYNNSSGSTPAVADFFGYWVNDGGYAYYISATEIVWNKGAGVRRYNLVTAVVDTNINELTKTNYPNGLIFTNSGGVSAVKTLYMSTHKDSFVDSEDARVYTKQEQDPIEYTFVNNSVCDIVIESFPYLSSLSLTTGTTRNAKISCLLISRFSDPDNRQIYDEIEMTQSGNTVTFADKNTATLSDSRFNGVFSDSDDVFTFNGSNKLTDKRTNGNYFIYEIQINARNDEFRRRLWNNSFDSWSEWRYYGFSDDGNTLTFSWWSILGVVKTYRKQ
jgi:hypothetical protein